MKTIYEVYQRAKEYHVHTYDGNNFLWLSTHHFNDEVYFQTNIAHIWAHNGPNMRINVNIWAQKRKLDYLKLTETDVEVLLFELLMTK